MFTRANRHRISAKYHALAYVREHRILTSFFDDLERDAGVSPFLVAAIVGLSVCWLCLLWANHQQFTWADALILAGSLGSSNVMIVAFAFLALMGGVMIRQLTRSSPRGSFIRPPK